MKKQSLRDSEISENEMRFLNPMGSQFQSRVPSQRLLDPKSVVFVLYSAPHELTTL